MTRKRGSNDAVLAELAQLRREVGELRQHQVRFVEVPVTAVDVGNGTFTVEVLGPDGVVQQLSGVASPGQFMPEAGQTVRLAVAGAQPIFQPTLLAPNSVSAREIAPGSVSEENLTFDIADFGGTTVFYGPSTPSGTILIGDLWVKSLGLVNGVQQHETRRWNGVDWALLADQKVTQALLDAAAAQADADQAGVDALAAQSTASQAQTTANSKTTSFTQTSPPSATGRVVGDEWNDSDDGNRRYYWNGTAWTTTPLGAAGISATARQLGAITTFRQASAPASGMVTGDYWLDSDDGNKAYRWSGTAWELVQDQAIVTALNNAATAQATADGKVRIFPQASPPTGLTSADDGDMWIDTDDGNRVYLWQAGGGTAARRNLAVNGSFEYDAPATLTGTTSASGGYTRFSSGSTGTLTHSIQATGGVRGPQYYKVVGSSMAPTAEMGVIFTRSIAAGDIVKVSADMWVTVASTTKPVQLYVDMRDAAGAVLTSTRITGTGAVGAQRLTTALLTAPAGAVTIRVFMMRVSSATGANGQPVSSVTTTNADVNLDGLMIELNPPAGAPTTYFDGSSGGESRFEDTYHLSPSTTYQETAAGAYAWIPRLLRTNAFQPNSIVASNVIATGTVSAALLEAILVLASIIIAGDPAGSHARMTSTGLRIYRLDPADNSLDEIGHFGSGSGDFMGGGLDASGYQAWSVDDTGQASFRKINSREDPNLMGERFSVWLGRASGAGNGAGTTSPFPGAQHFNGWAVDPALPLIGVGGEMGLTELDVYVSSDRSYWIGPEVSYSRGVDTELVLRIRDGGTSAPVLTSPEIFFRQFSNAQVGFDASAFAMGIWQPTTSGLHRLMLTAARQGPNLCNVNSKNCFPTINVIDLGPKKSTVAGVSRGVAGAPPPAQQNYVELSPAGWASYRGDGTLHPNSATDVVQGWDPSGGNGDCRGHWWFTLPSITGTVDRIQLYVETPYWYNNSGGTAIYNLTAASTATFAPTKLRGDFHVGPYPKAGAGSIDLPADWLPFFRNVSSPRAAGITVGPSGGTNLTYTGRFAAAKTRLRIWFTQ